jgi:hypothetical protein
MSEKKNEEANGGEHITVDGIVARRNGEPYLRLFAKGEQVGQLSMAQARNIAADIVQMCARTEADAMILRFFDKQGYPEGAGAALMMEFRKYRMTLDTEAIERSFSDPETGEPV